MVMNRMIVLLSALQAHGLFHTIIIMVGLGLFTCRGLLSLISVPRIKFLLNTYCSIKFISCLLVVVLTVVESLEVDCAYFPSIQLWDPIFMRSCRLVEYLTC